MEALTREQTTFESLAHKVPFPLSLLDDRELHIVELASEGQNVTETAEAIGLRPGSTRNIRSEILAVVNAFNIGQVVRMACDSNLFIKPTAQEEQLRRPSDAGLEVIELFSHGLSDRYIARELDIKVRATRIRRVRAIHALGARTFPHAIRLAWQNGWLSTQPAFSSEASETDL